MSVNRALLRRGLQHVYGNQALVSEETDGESGRCRDVGSELAAERISGGMSDSESGMQTV
eukprot:IDg7273t1